MVDSLRERSNAKILHPELGVRSGLPYRSGGSRESLDRPRTQKVTRRLSSRPAYRIASGGLPGRLWPPGHCHGRRASSSPQCRALHVTRPLGQVTGIASVCGDTVTARPWCGRCDSESSDSESQQPTPGGSRCTRPYHQGWHCSSCLIPRQFNKKPAANAHNAKGSARCRMHGDANCACSGASEKAARTWAQGNNENQECDKIMRMRIRNVQKW